MIFFRGPMIFKMGNSQPLFLYIRLFYIDKSQYVFLLKIAAGQIQTWVI